MQKSIASELWVYIVKLFLDPLSTIFEEFSCLLKFWGSFPIVFLNVRLSLELLPLLGPLEQ